MDAEHTRAFYWCYGSVGRDSHRGISIHISTVFSSCIYSLVTVQLLYILYRFSDSNAKQFSRRRFRAITLVIPNSCPFTCLFVAIITQAVNNTLSWRIFGSYRWQYKVRIFSIHVLPSSLLNQPAAQTTRVSNLSPGVLRRLHQFIDQDTHSAIPFRSQPQSQELRHPINF